MNRGYLRCEVEPNCATPQWDLRGEALEAKAFEHLTCHFYHILQTKFPYHIKLFNYLFL